MPTPLAYYNEHDPFAADWLCELIAEGHIAEGDVDTRDIEDVRPADLRGYTQCHFFAGIGGWSYALRLAGWPDDRPIWTGSCPCQPFSAAGKQHGIRDPRHLWPVWYRLIQESRPHLIVGEQVASAIGHGWLDLVSRDVEGEGYACGAVVLGAHSVGAPHQRQRLWWVAESGCEQRQWREGEQRPPRAHAPERHEEGVDGERGGAVGVVVHSERPCGESRRTPSESGEGARTKGTGASAESGRRGDARGVGFSASPRFLCGGGPDRQSGGAGHGPDDAGVMGDPDHPGSQGRGLGRDGASERAPWAPSLVEWLPCRDGVWRPVEPGTFPLAHGVPERVGRLRGYGNAIVPQVGAAFLRAYMDEVEAR